MFLLCYGLLMGGQTLNVQHLWYDVCQWKVCGKFCRVGWTDLMDLENLRKHNCQIVFALIIFFTKYLLYCENSCCESSQYNIQRRPCVLVRGNTERPRGTLETHRACHSSSTLLKINFSMQISIKAPNLMFLSLLYEIFQFFSVFLILIQVSFAFAQMWAPSTLVFFSFSSFPEQYFCWIHFLTFDYGKVVWGSGRGVYREKRWPREDESKTKTP